MKRRARPRAKSSQPPQRNSARAPSKLPALDRDLRAELLAKVLPIAEIERDFKNDGIDACVVIEKIAASVAQRRNGA